MDIHEKCAGCGDDVPADAATAGYIRTVENLVVDVVVYKLCTKCVRLTKTHPRWVARSVRATYERQGLN